MTNLLTEKANMYNNTDVNDLILKTGFNFCYCGTCIIGFSKPPFIAMHGYQGGVSEVLIATFLLGGGGGGGGGVYSPLIM